MSRRLESINPATEDVLETFEPHDDSALENILSRARRTNTEWKKFSIEDRARLFRKAAEYFRSNKIRLASMMTAEMGKPITQAVAEIEKCAWGCEFYAQEAAAMLSPEERHSDAGKCYVQFVPLGTVLAIMPWNYPIWQVVRFAAPTLMAGNTALLKHAPNVTRCALSIEEVFRETGFPEGVFSTILVDEDRISRVIEDSRVVAVSLTGSVRAGAAVASQAGEVIKKSVLELGGSDPFIVLSDADLEEAAETGIQARFQNSGQSCIAAKRFILVEDIYSEFEEYFVEKVRQLEVGDPTEDSTEIGPMARSDLRDALEKQVRSSVSQGAKVLVGGERKGGKGFYYQPTVLRDVTGDMTAAREEVFGPVASLIRVKDRPHAIEMANRTAFGLGATLWTRDLDSAASLAGEIEAGQVFVNGMVASDPRLPFGGIKNSGYGRELSDYGIREFVNVQTICIASD